MVVSQLLIFLFAVAGFAKLVNVLKSRRISSQRSVVTAAHDHVERVKLNLYSAYEEKKRRQTECHILEKSMAQHVIPRHFISRRSDRNPNGFNCAICRKDFSILSRGEMEIWRHAVCKNHYARDRRYRYDHEIVIFT